MMRWLLVSPLIACSTGCAITGLFNSTSSEFRPPAPEGLAARLQQDAAAGNHKVDHFAVLIGADTELRHRGNLSMAYQVLLEQGYQRERIFIFDSEGGTPFFPVADVTTIAALDMMFDYLSKTVEPHDTLFVYVTGHGRRITADQDDNGDSKTIGVSTLILNPGEEVSQDEFTKFLERVTPAVGMAFFDQCYWGQFSTPKLGDWITITTADPNETSHGVSFPRAFWQAFRAQPEGSPISIFEAFKTAMVEDRATRMGLNRPRISHGYLDPNRLLLTGSFRDAPSSHAVVEHDGTFTRP
jgi:hypothetical protein